MSKPPPPPGSERRKHARYDLVAQVQLRQGDDVNLLDVVNISAGGILLRLGEREVTPLRPGESLEVYLDLGNDDRGEPLVVTLGAVVVRVDFGSSVRPPSLALMWTSGDAEVAAQIARLLRYVQVLGAR